MSSDQNEEQPPAQNQPEALSDFERELQDAESPSFFGELWEFLQENKKWWLLPILMILLLFGVLVILSGTGAAPFIYTLH